MTLGHSCSLLCSNAAIAMPGADVHLIQKLLMTPLQFSHLAKHFQTRPSKWLSIKKSLYASLLSPSKLFQ